MKKIPTLFARVYENHKIVDILPEITPGCEEAFKNGIATIKIDGSCCAIINGELYKRYDAKKGRTPPDGAIPCDEPDPVTGHWPHWVKVDKTNGGDKWFIKAYENYISETEGTISDGTYEAIGKHFNNNPYNMPDDIIVRHGTKEVEVGRTFDDIHAWLECNNQEGLVFWLNGEPVCKIKRSDFGLKWPMKE